MSTGTDEEGYSVAVGPAAAVVDGLREESLSHEVGGVDVGSEAKEETRQGRLRRRQKGHGQRLLPTVILSVHLKKQKKTSLHFSFCKISKRCVHDETPETCLERLNKLL